MNESLNFWGSRGETSDRLDKVQEAFPGKCSFGELLNKLMFNVRLPDPSGGLYEEPSEGMWVAQCRPDFLGLASRATCKFAATYCGMIRVVKACI